jgi:hypothetical protein
MLLAQAPAADQARRVSDASFDASSKAGVFRMTAPKRYGGAEADFQTLRRGVGASARAQRRAARGMMARCIQHKLWVFPSRLRPASRLWSSEVIQRESTWRVAFACRHREDLLGDTSHRCVLVEAFRGVQLLCDAPEQRH